MPSKQCQFNFLTSDRVYLRHPQRLLLEVIARAPLAVIWTLWSHRSFYAFACLQRFNAELAVLHCKPNLDNLYHLKSLSEIPLL